jgi:NTE family protein
MTTAFVMWGGGSLGAAQVGMLRALTAHGVHADLVVGASVGALNGAYYAARPDADGVEELASLWLSVSEHDVYPLNRPEALHALAANLPLHPLKGACQALGISNHTFPFRPLTFAEAMFGRRNYLFDNRALRRFMEHVLPIEDLADARIPLSILTTDVHSGRAVVLTDGPAVRALLASAAIPAFYPSITIGEHVLMDGGLADTTTLDYAVEHGADEVYLLAPGFAGSLPARPATAIAMALHGYNLLSEQRIGASIRRGSHRTRLRLIPPLHPSEVLPIDFGQTADLIERADQATHRWLEHDRPPDHPARRRSARSPSLKHRRARPRTGAGSPAERATPRARAV